VRAALRVQAPIGDAQPLHWPAGNQVLGDNLFGVFRAHASVPYRIRIDHDRRAVLALVQTAGLVDAHAASQSGIARELLQARVQLALSVARAGGTRRIRGADVVADENMTLEYGQAEFSLVLREASSSE
jgi:hypothetical protein